MALPAKPPSLLQQVGNFIQQDLQRGAQSGAPLVAIPSRILQHPGQFVENVASDTGNIIKSTLGIPGAVIKSVSQGTEPQDLVNVAKGVGQTYANIAKDPYGTFIQHPVSTSMALAPAGKLLGGTAAAEGSIGDTPTANDIQPVQDDFSYNETPQERGINTQIAKTATHTNNKMITADQTPAPDDAVARYNSIFQVPRNIAQNMKIKPGQVINQLIDDGVTNVGSLDDLENVAKSVTGENGAFPKINRIILSDIKTPVQWTTDDIEGVKSTVNNALDGYPQGFQNTVTNEIMRALPKYPDLEYGNAYPVDLFDATQQLDRVANMYGRKAYTVMGDLTNPSYEAASNVIQEISNNLKDTLDQSISPEQYQMYKSDPRVMEQLSRVPVSVAQRWLDNATQFRDGRSIQAPYVALGKMVEDTKDAQLSAFTKWTSAMQKQQNSPGIAQTVVGAVTHPTQVVGDVAQAGIQKVISPFTDKTPQQVMQDMTSGQSATLKPNGGIFPKAGGVLKSAASVGARTLGPVVADTQKQNATYNNSNTFSQAEQAGGNNANNNPENHGNIVAQPYSNIKPDPATGQYELPQTPPQGTNTRHYMTTNDYQAALTTLGNTYTYGTPQYNNQKAILDAQFANDQKQADEVFKGNNVKNFMDNATSYVNDGHDLADTMMSLPTGFWNGVKQAGSIRAYSDQKYAQQLQQIDAFNNEFTSAYESVTGQKPTENQLLSSANSAGQAGTKYAAMMQFLVGTYGKYLSPYLSLTSATGAQTQTGTSQGYQGLPPITSNKPANANSIVGGTPPDVTAPGGLPPLPAL